MERKAYIKLNKEEIESLWNNDLTYWLKTVKDINDIDEHILKEWDTKLNDITNKSDIDLFCKHTDWIFKEVTDDINLAEFLNSVNNLKPSNTENYDYHGIFKYTQRANVKSPQFK